MRKKRAALEAAGGRTEQEQRAAAMRTKRKSNEAAGDRTEQKKNAAAMRKRRSSSEAAGDRTEQEKDTKARQLKREELRESRVQKDLDCNDFLITFGHTTATRIHANSRFSSTTSGRVAAGPRASCMSGRGT